MRIRQSAVLLLAIVSAQAVAQEQPQKLDETKVPNATDLEDETLNGLGFGPALYFIRYKDSIVEDSRDVRLRGDGTLYADQTKSNVALGAELHYKLGVSFDNTDGSRWGLIGSPYVGIFDIDDGINGIAVGGMVGAWKIDASGKHPRALNFGIGWITHKRRLVLADDVVVGQLPPAGLDVIDYTRRKDVEGLSITVSVSMGF